MQIIKKTFKKQKDFDPEGVKTLIGRELEADGIVCHTQELEKEVIFYLLNNYETDDGINLNLGYFTLRDAYDLIIYDTHFEVVLKTGRGMKIDVPRGALTQLLSKSIQEQIIDG